MDIIIGFDSLDASGYIFDDLLRAGIPVGSNIMLVSATDIEAIPAESEQAVQELTVPDNASWQREISPEERTYLATMLENARRFAVEAEEETSRNVRQGVAELQRLMPSASVEYKVVMASPFDAVCDDSNRRSADLVVVGSQNASSLTRFFLGSVSQKVVTYCHKPVRIARPRAERNDAPLRLLIAFDGSADSRHAIDAVALRKWPAGTEAKVITVAEHRSTRFFLNSLESRPDVDDASGAELVTTLAAAAAQQLRGAGLDAHAEGLEGDPKKVMLETAESWGADCIFLGAKGHRNSTAQPLGAVATAITTRAHCSVEVVR